MLKFAVFWVLVLVAVAFSFVFRAVLVIAVCLTVLGTIAWVGCGTIGQCLNRRRAARPS